MIVGWIGGSVIAQTLAEENWIADRPTYQAELFEEHRYIVGGDFVLGDYGGPCDPVADFLGAVCYCNQGGHAAVLTSLSNATWTTITNSGVNYTQNNCYSAGIELPNPLNVLTLSFQDYPWLAEAAADVGIAVSALLQYLSFTSNPVNLATLNVTHLTVQTLLNAELQNYSTGIVSGMILGSLGVQGYLVPAPIFSHPHLVYGYENYIYLMPTLEQQMYLLYENLGIVRALTSIGSSVNVVFHDYSSAETANITAVLDRSAATFNYDNPTVEMVANAETVGSVLRAGQINFVIAVTTTDVPDIVKFLSDDSSAVVVICFDDLTLQYGALVSAFASQPASVQARLVTFSNLPLWSDTSDAAHEASPLLAQYHGALPAAEDHTPSLLRDVVVTDFLLSLLTTTSLVNTTLLVSNVYLNGVFSLYGLTFGTFQWSCTATVQGNLCVYQNYGARDIAMLSLQRMLDPSVPVMASGSTPSLVYTPRPSHGLTAAQRNGVIAGSVIGGLVLIAAVALLLYCCSDSRNNDAAPKDRDEPVTLIFTDIESSTAMWAALPQLMADAIAAHHRVIRQVIKRYKCYEVKTIGDSFMIACKDAHSAVCLACEVQAELLGYDWGTAEIDSTYREFELARVDSVDGYVPTTARLSPEEYEGLWRGLRVRMGLHTGLSDIRYDEVTKGYDYYGDTSNMAARTEAIANGGQVVATETTWWALSHDERAGLSHTAMGPQGLRGVPYAVEMYQLNPVPGRTHAALRTEIEAILPDDGATETASSAADALLSSAGTMTGAAAGVAFVITSCFAPYPPVQRIRELQPLLGKWNIGAPPRHRNVSEEDYCKGLINRLAIRISSVTQSANAMRRGEVHSVSASFAGSRSTVLNPLSVVDSVSTPRARRADLLTPLSERGRSGMRESRVMVHPPPRQRPSNGAYDRTEERRDTLVRWSDDPVVPFVAPQSSELSMSSDGGRVLRNGSVSMDPVIVRVPAESGVRRRRSSAEHRVAAPNGNAPKV
ncbi:receptor-type adenylate cyclase [Novymonas esmeraldas]|uniref:adenylate cyclase n=1 Tax=Novymonas esmeraldas TaxID=1808958 RepID=A0AAW0F1B6_9TRYP